MKVGIKLGTTLNVGKFSNIKVDVYIEREVPDVVGTERRNEIVERLSDKLYVQVEEQLLDKIARLHGRLTKEGLID